jgi:hypothetical protein
LFFVEGANKTRVVLKRKPLVVVVVDDDGENEELKLLKTPKFDMKLCWWVF